MSSSAQAEQNGSSKLGSLLGFGALGFRVRALEVLGLGGGGGFKGFRGLGFIGFRSLGV